MHHSSEKGKKRKHFYICSVPFILGHDERGGRCADWCCEIFSCQSDNNLFLY